LVRNVLEDVFDAVEAVTENMGDLVGDVVEEAQDFGRRFERRWRQRTEGARERFVEMEREPGAEKRPEPPAPSAPQTPERPREFAEVSAWQPVVLNAARTCAGCGRGMRRGDPAYLGMGVHGVARRRFCAGPCLDRLHRAGTLPALSSRSRGHPTRAQLMIARAPYARSAHEVTSAR
jgi:hypothetical protein